MIYSEFIARQRQATLLALAKAQLRNWQHLLQRDELSWRPKRKRFGHRWETGGVEQMQGFTYFYHPCFEWNEI